MLSSIVQALLIALTATATVTAADIEGIVVVKRKLSKRKVTAAAGAYARGAAVELALDKEDDALAFERSHVVVYVDGLLPSEPVQAVLEQKNRQFVPDLIIVPSGSTVSFPNRDLIFHNVFSLSKTKKFDLGNYAKDQTRAVSFSTPGIVYVNCHLHPNMGATIVVTPNQWSTKADASGRFLLRNLPAGKHTIVAWHKAAGFLRQDVEVQANSRLAVEFLIPFTEEGASREAIAAR